MQEPDNKQEISSSVGTILGSTQETGSLFGVSRGGVRSTPLTPALGVKGNSRTVCLQVAVKKNKKKTI